MKRSRALKAKTGIDENPGLRVKNGAHDLSSTDLLELAFFLRARGSSKPVPVLVEQRGLEPLTPHCQVQF